MEMKSAGTSGDGIISVLVLISAGCANKDHHWSMGM